MPQALAEILRLQPFPSAIQHRSLREGGFWVIPVCCSFSWMQQQAGAEQQLTCMAVCPQSPEESASPCVPACLQGREALQYSILRSPSSPRRTRRW